MQLPVLSPHCVRALRQWFRKNKRDLPWRRTRDPYHILISEVMLQQTQVARVVPKYQEFLSRFPTIRQLAQASKGDVLRMWDGMGYNSRALRLHHLATVVVEHYGGNIPSSTSELQKLPGIGRYTSHAIASFAFKQRVPLVDTNVERIFSRFFPEEKKHFQAWEIAAAILPAQATDSWNQALMELGSLICTASSPLCKKCPWTHWCPKRIVPLQKKRDKKRKEPSLFGIPNRLYRGKIVQYLRHHQETSIEELLRILQLGTRHRQWLVTLLRKMEQDGLVEMHSNNNSFLISLPL